ncbi:type 2 lanthipeptide synthetase LanM family protein [Streptomyces sp. TG1A-8]|uniref:type 2 lanthipeptide synthetase LanM family protein n=1 Tax=Streptomyces sp. TG1A-8 TaxID=3051385 RepID=UPI00265BE599|nr:type 2 lanthipeptide synthetase LanM family protein [Streptomyces sp. TG1A-8]MDO0928845.1 type 2 lanthipeptide synthetase LanM family protein [Streptomyces sp. TG1A-8]
MTEPAALPTPRSAHLPPAWWAPALTLAERVAAPGRPAASPAAALSGRAPWAAGDTVGFAARLAHLGLDESAVAALAGEAPGHLAARTGTPRWAGYVEQAVDLAAHDARLPLPGGATGPEVFAPVVAPLAAPASTALDRRLEPLPAAERHVLRTSFERWLLDRLARLAGRTLVRELDRARRAGRLAGAGPRERFAAFCAATGAPDGLRTLFTAYPVLARMLGQTALDAADAVAELGLRLLADRADLTAVLFGGRDPGPLARIELGCGDAHRGGRSVAVLGFADGSRAVYKPRSLEHHALLDDLTAWLAGRVPGLELRTPRTVRRDDHGWLEFIEHRWCGTVTEADAFYRRQGALLALLYAVDGADMHYENVIACAGQPVLVDAETLLHTGLPQATTAGADPAADALQASVHRTCLLPHLLIGEHGALDISALGRAEEGTYPSEGLRWEDTGLDTMRVTRGPVTSPAAQNQPLPGGPRLAGADHRAALLEGFRTAYAAVRAHGGELAADDGPLALRADSPARLIVRSTRLYATLLEESTHPALLGDALARDAVFAVLWTESVHDPARQRLVEHETADLWRGDVPLFAHRPSGTGVRTADGTWLPGLLPVPALTAVRAKIARMDEVDCHDQEWIVSATLAARDAGSPLRRPRSALLPACPPAVAAEPSRLLAAACGIADEIAARTVRSGGRANWLGLERLPGGHWSVLPMGAGLAQGYSGVALFLAQAGLLAGAERYTVLAREAVRPLPTLLKTLAADPELCATVGPGAYDGLGGILYCLVRLSVVLDPELAESLPDALTALGHAVAACADPGLAGGAAGALAAAVAAHAGGAYQALDLADAVADGLAPAVARGGGTAGFAEGDAGIGWALSRHADQRADGDGHAAVATSLLRSSLTAAGDAPLDASWTTGLPGIAAAAAHLPGAEGLSGRLSALCDDADLSPGHGVFGALEALSVLADRGDATASAALARHTGRVLATVEAREHRCATPDQVPSPGLLTGLAGIGYGLLRLGFPTLVPSALLLGHCRTGPLPAR